VAVGPDFSILARPNKNNDTNKKSNRNERSETVFSKKSEETETHSHEEPRLGILQPEETSEVRRRGISVIGPTLRFKGELSAKEDLVIEGYVEGRIAHQDKDLTIGENGKVKADIHANVVDILGEVEGDVRGDKIVRLKASAKVDGNIRAPRLVLEDGAFFTGSIEMSDPKGDSRDKTNASRASAEKSNLTKLNVAEAPSSAPAPNGGG
jgi:cytoskeletal protein CcmA (bactofilin family)